MGKGCGASVRGGALGPAVARVGVRTPCARVPRPSAWPCPPSSGWAPRTERRARGAQGRGPSQPSPTPTAAAGPTPPLPPTSRGPRSAQGEA